ncbi:MAG: hypothetical protein LBE09_03595 [Christensenellaceae bacterium]|nr:hypothetical protein [Christensenellaceae bacterium]
MLKLLGSLTGTAIISVLPSMVCDATEMGDVARYANTKEKLSFKKHRY